MVFFWGTLGPSDAGILIKSNFPFVTKLLPQDHTPAPPLNRNQLLLCKSQKAAEKQEQVRICEAQDGAGFDFQGTWNLVTCSLPCINC